MTLLTTTPDACPNCGADTNTTRWHEDALVRHGGYGATRTTVLRSCTRCDWSLITERGDTKP